MEERPLQRSSGKDVVEHHGVGRRTNALSGRVEAKCALTQKQPLHAVILSAWRGGRETRDYPPYCCKGVSHLTAGDQRERDQLGDETKQVLLSIGVWFT